MFMTVKQASEKWGISDRRVRILCAEGKIAGAHPEGRGWKIPVDARKPADGRYKSKESLLAQIDRKKAELDSRRPLTVGEAARLSAIVTHNHPEGIKGAEATASAIFLARTGHSKTEIKEYIEREFCYELNRTCDEIRPGYFHTETCMETVPEAITAFLEGNSFEDVIRTAVSLGGDCDTLTAIAGSIAEGFYGVPAELKEECYKRLPEPLFKVLKAFEEAVFPVTAKTQ